MRERVVIGGGVCVCARWEGGGVFRMIDWLGAKPFLYIYTNRRIMYCKDNGTPLKRTHLYGEKTLAVIKVSCCTCRNNGVAVLTGWS